MSHGIHHVTTIARGARDNLAFYTGVLGLRLVKRTVNFDDPGTYHLYYGDAAGTPGTILTFFPWEHAARGLPGVGEVVRTTFAVPSGSLPAWEGRLDAAGVVREAAPERFGASTLAFHDPDGTALALVEVDGIEGTEGWAGSDVPARSAIRGFAGVRLRVRDPGPTAAILTDVLGFAEAGREGGVLRLRAQARLGAVVEIEAARDAVPGRAGAGSVHHLAFRAADDAAQAAMVARLAAVHGIRTSEQRDRDYFRSVYFREPGGVLFEIATDAPGFAVDEAADALGRTLRLPAALEPERARLEAALPPLA